MLILEAGKAKTTHIFSCSSLASCGTVSSCSVRDTLDVLLLCVGPAFGLRLWPALREGSTARFVRELDQYSVFHIDLVL